MKRITPDKFKTVPWKNGKGITQEILSSGETDNYDWRFSRAEVTVDGPFSIFENKSRILTVIEGNGISLISNESTIKAPPCVPVSFSGETPIEGKLWDGPIKDLNLIYSSERVEASALFVEGSTELELKPSNSRIYGVYCLSGVVNYNKELQLNSGDFGFVDKSQCCISTNQFSKILFYTLDLLSN